MWTLLNLVLMPEFKPGNPNSPQKLLGVIFQCVYHQHRVYGNSIINTVIPRFLFLLPFSPTPFISGGLKNP